MTEREKPDLSTIEPIGRVPDADDELAAERGAARVGRASAEISGAPPAVGVEVDVVTRERDAEPKTSQETESQLDQLRRG